LIQVGNSPGVAAAGSVIGAALDTVAGSSVQTSKGGGEQSGRVADVEHGRSSDPAFAAAGRSAAVGLCLYHAFFVSRAERASRHTPPVA
jgi:hypothetical protein